LAQWHSDDLLAGMCCNSA